MPRMKAFDGPTFLLQTANEKNVEDTEVLLELATEQLVVLQDGIDGVNAQLAETHLGHEAHLWGQEVDEDTGDTDEP